ncbi:hypothetical protein CN918_32350 [Priestia megaterium]|nr:hypothetical protein CN918_32350 [Priestia megaterium]
MLTYVWNETTREMVEKKTVVEQHPLQKEKGKKEWPYFLILVELVSASLMAAKVFSIILLLLSYLEPSTAFLQYTLPADLQLFDIISPKQAF